MKSLEIYPAAHATPPSRDARQKWLRTMQGCVHGPDYPEEETREVRSARRTVGPSGSCHFFFYDG